MTTADRKRLHGIMEVLIRHKAQLDYPNKDIRGPKDRATWKLTWLQAQKKLRDGEHLCFDCSQAVTQIFHWAGVSDPNGLAYGHAGYTGTMLNHLKHYSDPAHARTGALVVFGPSTGEHVGCVITPGNDPELFSHGLRGATGPILLSKERRFHDPPVTFLNVSGL